jgi:hypothetical protein
MSTYIPKREDTVGGRYVSWRTFQTLFINGRRKYYPWFREEPKPFAYWWLRIRANKIFDAYPDDSSEHIMFIANCTPTFRRIAGEY